MRSSCAAVARVTLPPAVHVAENVPVGDAAGSAQEKRIPGPAVAVSSSVNPAVTADHVPPVCDAEPKIAKSNSDAPDYYEVMQLSPNADANTISRVYRLLASQYHPDNSETGNSEMFLRLSEAYQILGDPQKRASYDLRRRDTQRPRGTIFTRASPHAASHVSHFGPSVGTLSGWRAALRSL